MIDRRKIDMDNWQDFHTFMKESRDYRLADEIKQKYQIKTMEDLNERVRIQNGRVSELEKYREEINIKLRDKKEIRDSIYGAITLLSTMISAIAVVWALFLKK